MGGEAWKRFTIAFAIFRLPKKPEGKDGALPNGTRAAGEGSEQVGGKVGIKSR